MRMKIIGFIITAYNMEVPHALINFALCQGGG